ncbi:MAG: hypothetical protein Kow0069_22290 [Promethearchaeota archaeon]
MRWILDANALIYLAKANLQDRFMSLVKHDVVIDTSVYEESVTEGIQRGYPDAVRVKKFLEQARIPIIPVDVKLMLDAFRDAGEASCFLLAESGGICITADARAVKKIKRLGGKAIHLDGFFYLKAKRREITPSDFEEILVRLEEVYATTPERKHEMLQALEGAERDE